MCLSGFHFQVKICVNILLVPENGRFVLLNNVVSGDLTLRDLPDHKYDCLSAT